ncbi:MAG: hypothetical protein QOJ26_879 [Thermoplasmata archaeon]|jgi:hypothetical protein|nr:hypothetical protein [Thermoplasmata archaeon]
MRSLPVLSYAAVAAGTLGVLHAPFHSAAYLATEEGASGGALLAWGAPFRDAVPGAFGFADAWGVYRAIGSVQPFVLAGMLAGLWVLHRLQAAPGRRFERMAFWALFGLWGAFTAATAVEYATPYRDAAFAVGFPALLLSLVGFIVYGIATLRAKVLPKAVGWSLIVGAAAAVPLAASFGHIAMALVLLDVALMAFGLLGLQARSGVPSRPPGAAQGRPLVAAPER